MEEQAKTYKLCGFEKIKKIKLEPISLIVHKCMTQTLKL